MRTKIATACFFLANGIAAGSAHAADFVNGNFSQPLTTGWSQGGGTFTTPLPSPYIMDPSSYTSGTSNNLIITSSANDPLVPVSMTYNGLNSVRVNDSNNNQSISTISQTVANYSGTTVNLAWSAVLQSASHPAADTDGFTLKVFDNTTNTVVKLVSYNAVSAASLFTTSGSYLYSGWRAESIAVTAGDTITVSMLATDCDAGGHFGYVYLSSFGSVSVGGSAPLVPGSTPSIPNIVSGNNRTSGNPAGFNLLSSVAGGSSFNNRFDGGALRVDSTATSSASFTITANKGYIDQYGNNATFGGQFTDDTAGVGGRLVIQNSATGGSVSLTNTHNTYSGGTEVNAGANLTINAGGALGSGAIDLVGTLTTPASLTVTQSTTIANNITVAYDPVINVATGQTTTITGTITNGVAPGDLVVNNDGSSTGTLVLTPGVAGANTYSGGTFVNAGVLQAGGVDALPTTGSVSVASGATFDLNSYNQQIGSLVGAGNTTLGSGTLTLANAADTFSGAISGAGALNITGGTETLSGANTYTGPTNVNGGTLNLTGTLTSTAVTVAGGTLTDANGGLATGTNLTVNSGTANINANQAVANLNGSGGTVGIASGQTLAVSNGGSYAGVVSGAGTLNIAGGTETLSGTNTFGGGVQVQSGAALTIASASALGSGTLALIGSNTTPSTLNVTGNTTIANAITVAGDPVFNISSGTTTFVSSAITNGSTAGDVVVSGGGILGLSAANTYTGLTAVNAGSTLALVGAGSIAQSTALNNSGTVDVRSANGNVALGGTLTQTSTGSLLMNLSPTNNQKVLATGAASLAGNLTLNAIAGTYSHGKYTLITANGVTGTFGSFISNLASYTRLGYTLGYDANNVYLFFTPNVADTQQSLVNTAAALQNTYTLQNSVLANSFSYDCNLFDVNNICVSAGGRNTAIQAANGLNNTSALLIASYRIDQNNSRVGAYADQNLSVNNAGSTVNLGNNTPLIGLFGAWSQRADGTGAEVKAGIAYGQKSATITRQVVGTSEPGSGSSQLNSQGAQVTAKYGFGVMENVIVSPYIGMRYTQNNMGGYSEAANASVVSPLTYSALNTNATTALAGVGASYRFIPRSTVFASAGVETDTNTANGTYAATGLTGLTPVNFNANPVKTRPTGTLGATYDIEKNQRLGITGIYRQEPFQAVSSTTVMATYTVGL